MSNIDFLLIYGSAPLGFLIAGLVVYFMARRSPQRTGGHHTPAE